MKLPLRQIAMRLLVSGLRWTGRDSDAAFVSAVGPEDAFAKLRALVPEFAPVRWRVDGRHYHDVDLVDALAAVALRAEIGDCAVTCMPAGGLPGGKGGFGANLRSAGKGAVNARNVSFSMCRDLYGRRLGLVNDEIRLRKWLSREEQAKRTAHGTDYTEPRGPTGLVGWHLAVPSWAEGVSVMSERKMAILESRRARVKTVLCPHWVAARAGGQTPPAGAPAWWGCSRGPRCKYAHGEVDLKPEAKARVVAERLTAEEQERHRQREAYVASALSYSEQSAGRLLAAVREAEAAGAGGGGGGGGGMETVVGSKRPRPTEAAHLEGAAADGAGVLSSEPAVVGWCVVHGGAAAAAVSFDDDAASNATCRPAGISALGDFVTVAAVPQLGVGVPAGEASEHCAAFTVRVVTAGVVQIGWMRSGGSGGGGSGGDAARGIGVQDDEGIAGVGDTGDSWAVDLSRCQSWHAGVSTAYGEPCDEEDVVTAGVHIRRLPAADAGAGDGGGGGGDDGAVRVRVSLWYALNQRHLGIAYQWEQRWTAGTVLLPAVSLEQGEVVEWRLLPPAPSTVPAPVADDVDDDGERGLWTVPPQLLSESGGPSALSVVGVASLAPADWRPAYPVDVPTAPEDGESLAPAPAAKRLKPEPSVSDVDTGLVEAVRLAMQQQAAGGTSLVDGGGGALTSPPKPASASASAPVTPALLRSPTDLLLATWAAVGRPPATERAEEAARQLLTAPPAGSGFTADELKAALTAAGIKCGGAPAERAQRWLAIAAAVTHGGREGVPVKLRASNWPDPAVAALWSEWAALPSEPSAAATETDAAEIVL